MVLAVVVSGCAPVMYRPTGHVTPLFERAGEVHTWARLELSGEDVFGGDVQAAASPLKHVSVFGGYARESSRRLCEAGAGVYAPVWQDIRAELLVGHGRGSVETTGSVGKMGWFYLDREVYPARADLARTFAQLNVGVRSEASQATGLVLKLSDVHLYNVKAAGLAQEEARRSYFETALFYRVGANGVGLELMWSYNSTLGRGTGYRFNTRPHYLSAGLYVQLDALLGGGR